MVIVKKEGITVITKASTTILSTQFVKTFFINYHVTVLLRTFDELYSVLNKVISDNQFLMFYDRD